MKPHLSSLLFKGHCWLENPRTWKIDSLFTVIEVIRSVRTIVLGFILMAVGDFVTDFLGIFGWIHPCCCCWPHRVFAWKIGSAAAVTLRYRITVPGWLLKLRQDLHTCSPFESTGQFSVFDRKISPGGLFGTLEFVSSVMGTIGLMDDRWSRTDRSYFPSFHS